MKSRMLLTGAGVLFAALAIAAPAARSQTFTTIDPPGSLATVPNSINPASQIVGAYSDAIFVNNGFLRDTDGAITTFNAPGSAYGTIASVITPQGLIVDYYFDASRREA